MGAWLVIPWLVAGAVCGTDPTPGQSMFGTRQYVEYIRGDLPLVVAAPHGGRETPDDIPDRTKGVLDMDTNTQELARTVAEVVHAKTGAHMHLIVSRLHRKKLDPNREIAEAAQGNALAAQVWKEYHGFVDEACAAAVKRHGVAFFIDLHGQSHPDVRVELGYLHSAKDLAATDEKLNEAGFIEKGSLQLIAARVGQPYAELIRGPSSLGALLEGRGFPATPSPRMPAPTEPFFSGGYTVRRHCDAQKHVTGLQVECNKPCLRDTRVNRQKFAEALVSALQEYLPAQLGIGLDGKPVRGGPTPTR